MKEIYGGSRKKSKRVRSRRRSRRRRSRSNKVGGGGVMIIRSNSFRSPSKNPMVCRKEKKMLGEDMFYDSEDCSNMMKMNIHPHHHHLRKRGSKRKHKKKKGKHSRRRKPKVIVMGSRCGNCGLQHGGAPCGMKGGSHHYQHGG